MPPLRFGACICSALAPISCNMLASVMHFQSIWNSGKSTNTHFSGFHITYKAFCTREAGDIRLNGPCFVQQQQLHVFVNQQLVNTLWARVPLHPSLLLIFVTHPCHSSLVLVLVSHYFSSSFLHHFRACPMKKSLQSNVERGGELLIFVW